ncbi:MAG: AAA family ATPase [Lachnospiraceae bacterium]|nr:AAA family ATPase [Lachnospiraceae bacterium]
MGRDLKGSFYGTDSKAENEKYARIVKVAADNVEKTRQSVASLQAELHELQDIYDVDEKEGLAQWFNKDARFSEVRQDLLRAERAKKKPYFGRIDIEDAENERRESLYIGKTAVWEDPTIPEVIDWRAPIASVYYDHGLGKCRYTVPFQGKFEVDLLRKRTYVIENDGLKEYYDSEVVANDELLTKYLSKSKRNVLSEIIATIQEEQNEIIRKNPHHNVLVQGSAGSGKTTVAMHRISYILYNYDREFKPDGFYIVGSNKVLLNYITGVLPDLDVYGIRQMTMEDLFIRLLYEDFDSKKHAVKPRDKEDKSAAFKSSGEWFMRLNSFLTDYEKTLIPIKDIVIEETGRRIMKASEIENAIKRLGDKAIVEKIEKLNDILTVNLENELYGKYYSYNVETQKKLTLRYRNYFKKFYFKGSVFDIYEEFLQKENDAVSLDPKALDLYDLASLAYIYKRIKETEVIQEASHVVIDEAQDFGIAVYRALKYCMSKCTFTVMGDVAQNINLSCGLGDWEELKEVMLPEPYDSFDLLRKSYRNTIEISNFATDILKHATFPIYPVEPIIRHGEGVAPKIVPKESDLIANIENKVKDFKSKGYETIAIICKDRKESKKIYANLKDRISVKMFEESDEDFLSSTVVIPIEYSKGLEFDAVIIANASKENYPKEDGYAKLLYVAATRALHELAVFALKDMTGLISDPIPEDRQNYVFPEDTFHKKAFVFEEEFKTKSELSREQAIIGDREIELRNKFGPKRITKESLIEQKKIAATPAKVHMSGSSYTGSELKETLNAGASYNVSKPAASSPKKASSGEFGSMPEGSSLKPIGHGRIDNSVKWINKSKNELVVTSPYGTLTLTMIGPETVRVLFTKPVSSVKPAPIPEEIGTPGPCKWTVVDSRDALEVALEKIKLRIEKRSGAITFLSGTGSELLKEKVEPARQYHGNEDIWWQYFDFSKKESLSIRGNSDSDWQKADSYAGYISFGNDSDRPALIMSSKGYQIMIPADIKAMLCSIPAYGPYVRFENAGRIEYYIRSAR